MLGSLHRPARAGIVATCLSALLIGVLVACGGDPDGGTTITAPSAPAPTEITTAPGFDDFPSSGHVPSGKKPEAGPIGSSVELVDQGSAPRGVLEYLVEEGHTEQSAMDVSITSAVDGAEVAVPTIRLGLTTRVVEADEAEFKVLQQITSVTALNPSQDGASEAQASMAPLVGAGTTFDLNRSGHVLTTDPNPPSGLGAEAAALLTSAFAHLAMPAVPMPSEEIGIGARWRSSGTLDLGAVQMDQQATFTLTGAENGSYSIEMELTQKLTGRVDGARIESGTGTGGGALTVARTTLMPISSTTTVALAVTTSAKDRAGFEAATDTGITVTTRRR